VFRLFCVLYFHGKQHSHNQYVLTKCTAFISWDPLPSTDRMLVNCPWNFLNVLVGSTLPVIPRKYNPSYCTLLTQGIGILFMVIVISVGLLPPSWLLCGLNLTSHWVPNCSHTSILRPKHDGDIRTKSSAYNRQTPCKQLTYVQTISWNSKTSD